MKVRKVKANNIQTVIEKYSKAEILALIDFQGLKRQNFKISNSNEWPKKSRIYLNLEPAEACNRCYIFLGK